MDILFKIKTNAVKNYSLSPNQGVICANSKIRVKIACIDINSFYDDKFMLQTAFITSKQWQKYAHSFMTLWGKMLREQISYIIIDFQIPDLRADSNILAPKETI